MSFCILNACKDTVRDLACNCGAVLLALMRRSGYEKVAKRTVDPDAGCGDGSDGVHRRSKNGRMPRAYFLLDNMRNNIEIFIITSGEQEQDFIQLMNVLFRDWWAANDEWDDVTEAGSIESIRLRNFLELLGRGSVFSVEETDFENETGR